MSASVHAGIYPPGADLPRSRHPSGADTPPRKQAPAYGQRAAGTHPTGIHSCILFYCLSTLLEFITVLFIPLNVYLRVELISFMMECDYIIFFRLESEAALSYREQSGQCKIGTRSTWC